MADTAPAYAALILADEGLPITADKITALLQAANVSSEPIWASLLAKALDGQDVKALLSNIGTGSGGAAPAAPAAAGAAAAGGDAAAGKKEEKKEEEKEESDDDMGFGLFD